MKCIMPLLVILLISVCTKAQDFNDANYEYHTLDSLSIKNTDLKNMTFPSQLSFVIRNLFYYE